MRALVALVLAAVVGSSLAAAPQAPTALDLARRIQDHYDAVQDFAADFTMTYRGALLRQSTVERGHVRIKKPNRMWWTYTSPDKKEYVADGTRFYQHHPQDKLGVVTPLPKTTDASTSLLFLAGKGDLMRDFSPAVPATQPENEWRLILTPRKKQQEYERLTLAVDRSTLALRELTQQSDDGSTTVFSFTRFRQNIGLKDSDFEFRFPKGTEIR